VRDTSSVQNGQLEMQLIVARVAVAAAMASEVSARTSLEAAHQSAEDRAAAAEAAAVTAVTKRDSLASRLMLVEAEVEKLRAAAVSAEEAAERAKTAASATKTAARDAAQAAAREKATLEVRVSELERDLGTATTDLATTGCQFSQVTNQLQVAIEEAAQLCDNNAKLSQDLDGKLHGPSLSLLGSLLASHQILIH
jgi:chromosome segregation ATPase